MSLGDPWDGYFYPNLTLMLDSYILMKYLATCDLSMGGKEPLSHPSGSTHVETSLSIQDSWQFLVTDHEYNCNIG